MQPLHLLASPFASVGDKTIIPAAGDATSGLANLEDGFPFVTQKPISQGGVAPKRTDFNGILYMLSAFSFFGQSGGVFEYRGTLGYDTPAIVFYGGRLWYCLQANGPEAASGAVEPGTNEEYWTLFSRTIIEDAKNASIPIGGGFNSKQTITVSGPYVAPVSGTYKITCIGGGGGGGAGGAGHRKGGRGGSQGGQTSFGQLLTALGGSGGGGGATNGGGGGGQAGLVADAYLALDAGASISCAIGNGGAGGTYPSSNGQGTNGSGPTPGRGSTSDEGAGGGAPGASNGSLGTASDGNSWDSHGTGGAGAFNHLGHGHGGGGGRRRLQGRRAWHGARRSGRPGGAIRRQLFDAGRRRQWRQRRQWRHHSRMDAMNPAAADERELRECLSLAGKIIGKLAAKAYGLATDGGEGSGNFGHAGRPGEIGGSGEGDGETKAAQDITKLLGPEYTGYKGQAAIEKLLKEKQGHVKGAFRREDIGEIDLIWGDDTAGLQHIIKQRETQNIDTKQFFNDLTEVVEKGKMLGKNSRGNFEILYNGKEAVVSPELQGNKITFLVTAFKTRRKE
jgi:hypothetical protein